ncbi:uncharacterized protein [Typha angustifolia]|uniref:uncharacterized protein n=1 Tax=Typha angustifolia TaxID=59011 RepID=UPI003C2B6BDC
MGNPRELYFRVLDISKDSSPQEIRSAYKTLVKKWHPDKHPPSSKPEAEAKFKAITEAYEALSDLQVNRAVFVVDGGGGGSKGEDFKPTATLNNVKSHEKGSRDVYYSVGNVGAKPALSSFSKSFRRQPPPIEKKLECTLEELCHGCKKEINYTRDVVTKNGLIVKKEETHTIRVKPGWKKGTRITFEGMGDERPGYLPADVIVLITEKEHPVFKRVGNDLVLKVEVSLADALAGWKFSFRLLTGEKMSCSFHEQIIYPGYEKVIKGQGMPLADEKGVRGNLRIKFSIIFPKQLSNAQRSGIVELLKDCT